MIYESFYFLHIPKTAGHFIRSEIIDYLTPGLKDAKIKIKQDQHAYWSKVDDKTYVISSIRNPIERTVSHYAWNHKHFNNNLEINVLNMMKWLEKNNTYISNFQSKSFLYDSAPLGPTLDIKDTPEFNTIKINDKLLIDRLKRINILIRNDSLTNVKCEKLKYKIHKDLSLKKVYNKSQYILNDHNINDSSKILYKMLSKKEIKFIESLNQKDLEIYNNKELFWNG